MILKSIPFEKGPLETMIDRLYKTMNSMDQQWSKKVEPASENKIHTLEKISGLEEKGKTLPLAYLLYLRAMGENDNGLLEQEWEGKAEVNIDSVLKNYKSFKIYEDDVDSNEYMPFLTHWTGAELFLKLTEGENPSIHYFDFIKDRTLYSGSFEKYLFQKAFLKAENTQFSYRICLAVSQQKFQDILSQETARGIEWKQPMEFIENILKSYKLQKAWFSDDVLFYGISPEYVMSVYLYWGLSIRVSSDNYIALQNIKESLTASLGDPLCNFWYC